MMKFLPSNNMKALKVSLNKVIQENNISCSKFAKNIGITTNMLKQMRDVFDEKTEISPVIYTAMRKNLDPIQLDLGEIDDNYYNRLMVYLYSHGYTMKDFYSITGIDKDQLNNIITENGISYKYKDQFSKLSITEEEFETLNNYRKIELSNDRDGKIINSINYATNINYFMIKRGYNLESFAIRCGYTIDQTKSILGGFITNSIIAKVFGALGLSSPSAIEKISLNSYDLENNFGYFLQKLIYEKQMNIYNFAESIGINYCNLKGIVSGTKNISEDEFDKISKALNLDPWELEKYSPNIEEGDDKYIPYNFIKWIYENPEVPYNKIEEKLNRDIPNLMHKVKYNLPFKPFTLDDIAAVMTITGLSKNKLKSKLSHEEIDNLKSMKRTTGVKSVGISDVKEVDDTFENFIKRKIKENGFTMKSFSELLDVERTIIPKSIKNNRIRKDILDDMMDVLEIDESDIRKYNVKTYISFSTKRNKHNQQISLSTPKKNIVIDHSVNPIEDNEEIEFIDNRDRSSIYPDSMKTFDFSPSNKFSDTVQDSLNIIKNDKKLTDYVKIPEGEPINTNIPPEELKDIKTLYDSNINIKDINSGLYTDDKEFMMEELDKFLLMYENLSTDDQNTLIRIMNCIKHPEDLSMKNIPEECFLDNRFSNYKKIDYIIKLTELDK